MEGRRSNLVPLGSILDVRPLKVALDSPLCDACHIPLSELNHRVFELPPKGATVDVANCPEAGEAQSVLEASGRGANVVAARPARRFEQHRLWKASAFVEEFTPEGDGKALDLGCGSGRNALYLASLGYQVSAVDSLPDAISMGKDLERRYLSDAVISWAVHRILKIDDLPVDKFDVIVCSMFVPPFGVGELSSILNSGGLLIAESYSSSHREETGKPKDVRSVLTAESVANFEVLRYEESQGRVRTLARARP